MEERYLTHSVGPSTLRSFLPFVNSEKTNCPEEEACGGFRPTVPCAAGCPSKRRPADGGLRREVGFLAVVACRGLWLAGWERLYAKLGLYSVFQLFSWGSFQKIATPQSILRRLVESWSVVQKIAT